MGKCKKCCWCGTELDPKNNMAHACTGEEPYAKPCLEINTCHIVKGLW